MYDSLRGEGFGDELYVEGMDDAFLEWRAQHGQEWARYYGLTVSGLTFAVYLGVQGVKAAATAFYSD